MWIFDTHTRSLHDSYFKVHGSVPIVSFFIDAHITDPPMNVAMRCICDANHLRTHEAVSFVVNGLCSPSHECVYANLMDLYRTISMLWHTSSTQNQKLIDPIVGKALQEICIRISLSMLAAFDHRHRRAGQMCDNCLSTLIGSVLMRPKQADRSLSGVASKTTQRSATYNTRTRHTCRHESTSQTSFRHPQAHTRATSTAEKFDRAAAEQRSLIPTPRPNHKACTRRVASRHPTVGPDRVRVRAPYKSLYACIHSLAFTISRHENPTPTTQSASHSPQPQHTHTP